MSLTEANRPELPEAPDPKMPNRGRLSGCAVKKMCGVIDGTARMGRKLRSLSYREGVADGSVKAGCIHLYRGAGKPQDSRTDGTRQGRVILLNGASSAGKSTLAATLRELLEQPSIIFSMDNYLTMSRGGHENALDAVRKTGLPFIESFHAAIAEAARKGVPVIVDHVIGESPLWIRDLMNRLGSIPCVRIRVDCRRDILREREQKRTDRAPDAAHAERQHGHIHQNFPHDFSIDTSEASPGECARELMRRLPPDFLLSRKQEE